MVRCNISKKKKIKKKKKIAYNHNPPGFCLCHQGIYEWNHHLFFRIINELNLIMKTISFLCGFVINNLSFFNIEFFSPFFPCVVFMPYRLPHIHSQGNHGKLGFYFLLNITGLILFTFKYFVLITL